jgi:MarR family transcriptional regulator, lower aerobic nicotinate degradation pathway regulator
MNKLLPPSTRADAQAIFDSLRKIVRAIRLSSKKSEKEIGISSAQFFVLQKIAERETPPSINELAEATLTHQSSVSVVVSKLLRKKLIERVRSQTNSRSVEVRLSKQGLDLLRESHHSLQERLMNAVVGMEERDRQGLVQGLAILIQKAGLQEEEESLFFEDRKAKRHESKTG